MAYMSSRRREWHHGRTSHSQLSKQTAFVDPFLLLPLRDQDAIQISQDEGRPLPLTSSSVQLAGSEPRPQPATPPVFLFSSQQRGQVDIPCTQLKGGTTFGDTSPPSSISWYQGINPATLSDVKTTRATPLFSLHKDKDLAVRSPLQEEYLRALERLRERHFFPASGIESCRTPHDSILAPQTSNLATRGEPEAHHGPPLMGKDTGEEPRVNQTPNWDAVKVYDALVWSYVEQCPINLFDTKRQRNISRSELKEDITAILERWFSLPLSCSELEKTILDAALSHSTDSWLRWTRGIRPFVVSALLKTPVIDVTDHFISTLTKELKAYQARVNLFKVAQLFPFMGEPHRSVVAILKAVRELIEQKRAHPPMPSKQDVKDQIEILGQYVILSHRWDDEELSFADVENFSDPLVRAKKGFQKLAAFSKTVERDYGCRYIWMDTVCISEEARNRSIPLMFGWYRRAYVCVVYLTDPGHPEREGPQDPWFTRGWTLQEVLAAPRINVSKTHSSGEGWHPHRSGTSIFSACRDNPEIPISSNIVHSIPRSFDWFHYEPGLESALPLFKEMIHRETKRPEDKVYCLLSALNVDIPIMYGEGLDHAFYRLQAHYLTQTYDRRCLLWPVKADCFMGIPSFRVKDVKDTRPSPWNSMLAAGFDAYSDRSIGQYRSIVDAGSLPDPSISLDEGGVMRIMASLFPWKDLPYYPSQRDSRSKTPQEPDLVFASLHFLYSERYYGVLLRPIPPTRLRAIVKNFQDHIDSDHVVYERVSLKVFPKSELPFHEFVKPEWIYIR